MKHAIMVMGFGDNPSVLQETINILDDNDIDFIIHWDKKSKLPKLNAKKSKLIFFPLKYMLDSSYLFIYYYVLIYT